MAEFCEASKASSSMALAEHSKSKNNEKDLPQLWEIAAVLVRLHEATLWIEHPADGAASAGQFAENDKLKAVAAHKGNPLAGLSLGRHDGQRSCISK